MHSPALAAQIDWMQQGAFFPESYQGKEREQYEQARAAIERQWDNQPR
jgi:hypothetical protein